MYLLGHIYVWLLSTKNKVSNACPLLQFQILPAGDNGGHVMYFAGICSLNVFSIFLVPLSSESPASDSLFVSIISGNFQHVTYATLAAKASNKEIDASNSRE